MDLSTLKPVDSEIELTHPVTGAGVGFFFQMRSPFSDEVKAAENKWLNTRLRKRKKNLTAESLDAQTEAKLDAAMTGWRYEILLADASEDDDPFTIDGEQPEYSPLSLRKLIRKHAWVLQFLTEELEDYGNFFKD